MKSLGWIFLSLFAVSLMGSLIATDASAARRMPRCAEEVKSCRNNNDATYCMTCNAVREALNQGFEGMVYVNQTVLTRTKTDPYPDNICATIYQPKQFSWTVRPRTCVSEEMWELARKSAKEALKRGPNDKLFYHAHYVRPRWSRRCIGRRVVGAHIFYRMCGSLRQLAQFKRESRIATPRSEWSPAVTDALTTKRTDLPNGVSQ